MPTPPAASDRFVGRRAELARLEAALETARLISVTGGPGVGKTRLVVELTARPAVAEAFGDEIFSAALAPIADPAMVSRALAAALSVPEHPGRSAADAVAAHLGDRRVLVVLDNCEHVVGAVAALVAELVERCAHLVVVATTQEALGVAGEHVFALGPLPTPPPGAGRKEVAKHDSVQLFVARAKAAAPGFGLDEANAQAVATVCRRLDGNALALELAASMASVLSPSDIADRLAERFDLLDRPQPAGDVRHVSVRAALEWSYGLLSLPEQVLLRRLGVFCGGAGLEAIEASCGGGQVEAGQVLSLLATLVRRCLVVVDTATSSTRYRLAETIRSFAIQHLEEAGELDQIRHAHARWCLSFAEVAEAGFCGPDQLWWLARTDQELDNLRAALGWLAGRNDAEGGLGLAGALVIHWRVRSSFSEGISWLAGFLEMAGVTVAPRVRAKALWGWGFLSGMVGRVDEARPALEEAAALFEAAGDAAGQGRALMILGNCLVFGEPEEGIAVLERAAVLAEKAGDVWCLGHALALTGYGHMCRVDMARARGVLAKAVEMARGAGELQGLRLALLASGDLAVACGEFASAKAALEECLAVSRSLDDAYACSRALGLLAMAALAQGNMDAARPMVAEALDLARRAGNPLAIALAQCTLGHLALGSGDLSAAEESFTAASRASPVGAALGRAEVAQEAGSFDVARSRFHAALRAARQGHDQRSVAVCLYGLGRLARRRGAHRRAVSYQRQAIVGSATVGDRVGIAHCLEELGTLAVDSGRVEQAARLFGAARSLLDAAGVSICMAAEAERAREALGDDRFNAAVSEGLALSVDEAVAFATRGGPGAKRPQHGWEALTPVEGQIVALVAKGRTNPHIAKRLLMSPRTVDSHLRLVFAKLDVASRTELAVLADRHERGQSEGDGGTGGVED